MLQPSETMVEKLAESPFLEPWEESDVTIKIEDQKLYVHSLILTMASPVFKKMLSCGMKESQTKEIELKGKKLDDAVLMLKAIYPQYQLSLTTNDRLAVSQLKVLLEFSKEYMIDSLISIIEQQIQWKISKYYQQDALPFAWDMEQNIFTDIMSLLTFADKNNLKSAIESCAKAYAKFSKGSFRTTGLNCDLNFDEIKQLSSSTQFKFCAVMLDVKGENVRQDKQLTPVIRYMAKITL